MTFDECVRLEGLSGPSGNTLAHPSRAREMPRPPLRARDWTLFGSLYVCFGHEATGLCGDVPPGGTTTEWRRVTCPTCQERGKS